MSRASTPKNSSFFSETQASRARSPFIPSDSERLSTPSVYSRLDTFSNSKSRFNDDANFRRSPSYKEKSINSHLGPGSYDADRSLGANLRVTRPGSPQVMIVHKSNPSRHVSYTQVPCSPPVGTYTLPSMIGDPINILTARNASFMSSGRQSPLHDDGATYRSSLAAARGSHIGPGFYDQLDKWNTHKTYVRSANYMERQYSPETVPRVSTNNDRNKPWKTQLVQKALPGIGRPSSTPGGKKSLSTYQKKIMLEDIDDVRNLPKY